MREEGETAPKGPRVMETIGGNFEVLSDLGRGGYSRVYECRQLTTDRIVAVKVLQKTLSASDLKRFQNEAQILSSLNHPNLVQVFGFGLTEEKNPYIAMERLEGITLAQRIADGGPLSPGDFVEIFEQLLQVLGCLHREGIVHRDLKPSNVMISFKEGCTHATLFDLGIAKRLGDEQGLTATGDLPGTPLYMSPEQCTGSKIDERSDLYSLGCMMYESVAGKPLFEGSVVDVMIAHSQGKRPDIPKPIGELFAKMLAISPDQRAGTADEVLELLRSLDLAELPKFENSPGALVSRDVRGMIILYCSVLAFVVATGMSVFFLTLKQKTAEAHEKLCPLLEYTDPISEVRTIVSKKQIQRFPAVRNELNKKSESWWKIQQREFTVDLNTIGTMALQEKNREICESAFATAILSVKKRQAKDDQIELMEALVNQLHTYANEKICDKPVMNRTNELLLLSNQITDVYLKQRAYSYIAEIYSRREEWVLSKRWYERAFQLRLNPKTTDDKTVDLNTAVSYCEVLRRLDNPPHIRQRILGDRVQELQDLMQEVGPPGIPWITPNGFATEANYLPLSYRPKSFVKSLVRLMQTAELTYSNEPASVRNIFRIYEGIFECQIDKAQARITLLKAVQFARDLKDFPSFRNAVYALNSNEFLSPRQRLSLLVEAHDNIKRESNVQPETGFLLCYYSASVLAELGRLNQTFDYYRESLGYAKRHRRGVLPKEDEIIEQALVNMAMVACKHNNFGLARDCLREFDRLSPGNAQIEICRTRLQRWRKKLEQQQ